MPILDLYYCSETGDSVSLSLFFEKKGTKNHVGSPVFSADSKTIYFTRLVKSRGRNVLKIFTSSYEMKMA